MFLIQSVHRARERLKNASASSLMPRPSGPRRSPWATIACTFFFRRHFLRPGVHPCTHRSTRLPRRLPRDFAMTRRGSFAHFYVCGMVPVSARLTYGAAGTELMNSSNGSPPLPPNRTERQLPLLSDRTLRNKIRAWHLHVKSFFRVAEHGAYRDAIQSVAVRLILHGRCNVPIGRSRKLTCMRSRPAGESGLFRLRIDRTCRVITLLDLTDTARHLFNGS